MSHFSELVAIDPLARLSQRSAKVRLAVILPMNVYIIIAEMKHPA